jgi:hypothetical protein
MLHSIIYSTFFSTTTHVQSPSQYEFATSSNSRSL